MPFMLQNLFGNVSSISRHCKRRQPKHCCPPVDFVNTFHHISNNCTDESQIEFCHEWKLFLRPIWLICFRFDLPAQCRNLFMTCTTRYQRYNFDSMKAKLPWNLRHSDTLTLTSRHSNRKLHKLRYRNIGILKGKYQLHTISRNAGAEMLTLINESPRNT